MIKPAFLKRSLISSLVVMLPLLLVAAGVLHADSSVVESVDPDNDPMRATWLLLYLSPIMFVVISFFYYLSARILFFFKRLKFINHLIMVGIFSVVSGATLGHDDIRYLLIFTVYAFAALSLGLLSWHFLDRLRFNKKGNSVNAQDKE